MPSVNRSNLRKKNGKEGWHSTDSGAILTKENEEKIGGWISEGRQGARGVGRILENVQCCYSPLNTGVEKIWQITELCQRGAPGGGERKALKGISGGEDFLGA